MARHVRLEPVERSDAGADRLAPGGVQRRQTRLRAPGVLRLERDLDIRDGLGLGRTVQAQIAPAHLGHQQRVLLVVEAAHAVAARGDAVGETGLARRLVGADPGEKGARMHRRDAGPKPAAHAPPPLAGVRRGFLLRGREIGDLVEIGKRQLADPLHAGGDGGLRPADLALQGKIDEGLDQGTLGVEAALLLWRKMRHRSRPDATCRLLTHAGRDEPVDLVPDLACCVQFVEIREGEWPGEPATLGRHQDVRLVRLLQQAEGLAGDDDPVARADVEPRKAAVEVAAHDLAPFGRTIVRGVIRSRRAGRSAPDPTSRRSAR